MKQSILIILLGLFSISLFASNEIIYGDVLITIKDKLSEPLSNATVKVLNTPYQGITDNHGTIRFSKLEKGNYEATISRVGYSVAIVKFIITDAQTVEISVNMRESIRTLDEVVVSAERSDKDMLRTPVSATVINSKKVKESRIWQFDDLGCIAPNFNIAPSGGGFYNMSVRGISAFSKVPAVISYIDDVPVSNGYVMAYNLNDIAQIEMLRGPQGTLYGRGANGGVIIINSKKPANNLNGFAEASFGNYNQQRYNAGLNAPLIKNKLFIAASGMYNHINGFFTNKYDNKRIGDETAVGGQVRLSFVPNERWAFNYQLRGEKTVQDGTYLLGKDKDDAIKNAYVTNVDKPGASTRYILSNAFVANYYGKHISIKSVTAHQLIGAFYKDWDLDGSPLDHTYYFTPINRPSHYFTQEIKFSNANKTGKLNWVAGLFYLNGKDIDDLTYHYGKAADSFNAGTTKIPPPYETETHSVTKTKSYAVFGQVSYKVIPSVELQAGLRYEYEHQKLAMENNLLLPGRPAIPTMPLIKKETNFNAFSPKFTVLHSINDNNSVYASYTRGYRPGGVNPYMSDDKYLSFKPEYSDNIEAGYKLKTANSNFRLNLSAFMIKLKDQQIYTITSGMNFATLNVGVISSKGVEAELSYIPAKGLQFDWNIGYANAKYLKFPYFVAGPQGPQQKDLKNNKPLISPDITSFMTASYHTALSNVVGLSIRGEWKFTGDQFFDYANTIQQKAYSVFNTRVAVNYKNYELALWGRNLADKRFLNYAYPFALINAKVAPPRMYGVTVSARF